MNSSDRILARRYALALVTQASEPREAAAADARLAHLRAMRAALNADMGFLLNPLLPFEPKRNSLRLRLREWEKSEALAFLELLLKVKRFYLLDQIIAEAGRVSDGNNGIVRGRAVSAGPLQQGAREALSRAAGALAGKKAALEFTEDAALVGGVRIELGDILIDGSVAGRLNALKRRLNG